MTISPRRLGLALVLATVAGCAQSPTVATPPFTPSATPRPAPSAAPSPSPARPVTIVLGGDVDLDRAVRAAIARDGVDAPWVGIAPRLRAADLALLNLECAVSLRGSPQPKTYRFRGDPSALEGARRAGVDVFSLANNHTLDYGPVAFADTLAAVRAAGIVPVGGGRDLAEAQRAAVLTVRGVRVAFVGISAIIPAPSWKAAPGHPGIAYDDSAQITAQVSAAARQADVVVAFFHWGIEYSRGPSPAQRRAALAAIRAGATIVAGTHTHVLQPVEVVEGRLVAWSLSNLVFQSRPESVLTELLTVTVHPDGRIDWRTDPHRIGGGIPRPDPTRRPRTGSVPAGSGLR